MSEMQADKVVPIAVKNNQTHVVPDQVRNMQKIECEEDGKMFNVFPYMSKCKVPRRETAGAIWARIDAV